MHGRKRSQGSVMIEFALVFPVLLAIVAGILYYGAAFALSVAAQSAAGAGARAAVSVDPLAPEYKTVADYKAAAARAATLEAKRSLSWLPDQVIHAPATVKKDGCGDANSYAIAVHVTIVTKSDTYTLLPVLSFGGYQIPPGPNQVKADACATL